MFNAKDLKVGDRVGYSRYYYGAITTHGFSTVA